jgi:hypothetical protein
MGPKAGLEGIRSVQAVASRYTNYAILAHTPTNLALVLRTFVLRLFLLTPWLIYTTSSLAFEMRPYMKLW